jgi:thioredoxin 1
MNMATTTITNLNFETEVLQSEIPVLIDFWADWCGPCTMLSPIVEEIAEELINTVKVVKINTDDEPELAASFNIMSIPTLIVIKKGKVVATSMGVKSKEEIKSVLKL